MPIERMSVPGLNSIMANPNVLGAAPMAQRRDNGLDPVVMQQGGLVGEASTLQNAGRGGDSMLVHMNPEEVGALNQLGDSGLGGLRNARMTINPQTGLPEMFQFSSLLPMIAGIAATAMGGGPLVAAAAAAGGSLGSDVIEDRPIDLGRALLSGVASYAGAGIAGDVGPAGVPAASASELGATQMLTQQAGVAGTDASRALLTQAGQTSAAGNLAGVQALSPDAAILAGGEEAATAALRQQALSEPLILDGIQYDTGASFGPVGAETGATGYVGGYESGLPPTYADGTPIREQYLDLARNDPAAYSAAVQAEGGTTPFSQQDISRNLARETWRDDVGGNLKRGMGKISPFEWEASKAGEIGLGEIAQPAMVAVGAGAGALPPEPWEPSAAPSRRSYAYDTSGMQDRSYEIDSPPEGYVPGEDPEWEYIRDTTPAVDFGGGLGSLGSEEPFTFLSEHGYRGRGDLPTVYAADGGQANFPYGKKAAVMDWMTPSGGFGPPKPMREWTRENLPSWYTKITDPFNLEEKLEKRYAKAPNWLVGGLQKSYKRSRDPEYGLDNVGEGETTRPGYTQEQIFADDDNMDAIEQQDLPTLNAALGSRSGTAYPQSGGQMELPAGWLGGPLSGKLPWDKFRTYFGKEEEETGSGTAAAPMHPLTREEEDERMRGLFDYYRPADWDQMQGGRSAVPAQDGTEGATAGGLVEPSPQQLPPELAATTGIMDVSPRLAQDAVAERMGVTPSPDQPQNPEERAIFDQALLALQGVLDPVVAEQAISEFIETFGPDAYRELVALVENDLDEGGIVKPANGETTVAMGDMQGPDMIPGNIVDPMTGERTANLNVGENEYIEPAPSLARRAMAAGMPPTPENGALVRGAEEDELKAMYG
jgi:hypothetical protein